MVKRFNDNMSLYYLNVDIENVFKLQAFVQIDHFNVYL